MEWTSQKIAPRMIRTGCRNIWDAIFWVFRDYRELDTETKQENKIREKTGLEVKNNKNVVEQMDEVKAILQRDYAETEAEDDDENEMDEDTVNRRVFFSLLNMRLLETELYPYLEDFVKNRASKCEWKEVQEEWLEKSFLLAEYRVEKKMNKKGISPKKEDMEKVRDSIEQYLLNRFPSDPCSPSYDRIQQACGQMGYNVILISPSEKVLFDSLTWKDGGEDKNIDSSFMDNILILAHPDGSYESLGTFSYTKEGLQKITRIFSAESDIICYLRREMELSDS